LDSGSEAPIAGETSNKRKKPYSAA
jgi:hypothetical protein